MSNTSKTYTIQKGNQNPILRNISEKVEKITSEIKEICEILPKLMWKNQGVGLAAPQIGKNIRIISTTQWDQKGKEDKLLGETIMINPEIVEVSQDNIIFREACISLPDIFGKVRRYKSIVVEYMDIKGNIQKKKYKDFNAVIIQHEIDHLDGILFTDKLVKKEKK